MTKNKIIELKRKKRQEKIAHKRRKSLRNFIIFVVSVLALVTFIFFFYQADLFSISKITIKGSKYLSKGQILKAAAPPRKSNFFNFPYKAVKKRVKSLPWVEFAEVDRSFPGEIIITIKERKPFGYFYYENVMYIVDYTGYVISAESFKRFKLPLIEDIGIKKITIGKKINSETYNNIVEAFRSLPKEIQSKIYSLSSPSEEELTFIVNGIQVIYGKAEQTEIKKKVINKFLKSKNKENISVIDVSIPNRPTTREIGSD